MCAYTMVIPKSLYPNPTQNAFIESFNGHFRDACLDAPWFTSVAEARIPIAAWRQDDNPCRPHRAQGYPTPVEFCGKSPRNYVGTPTEQERI